VNAVRTFQAGDVDGAEEVFDAYLPVLHHGQQSGFGLAIRKEILRRRGAIRSAAIRHPGSNHTARDHQELDDHPADLARQFRVGVRCG
jgi:4-hydroxy-tetrahydrodipicolinate synthase